MSRDAPIKADKDYSQILKEEFPKIDSLAQNDCNSALDQLLLLEKKTRQASDLASSKEVLAKIVDLLASRNKWDDLNEQLTLLSKKAWSVEIVNSVYDTKGYGIFEKLEIFGFKHQN